MTPCPKCQGELVTGLILIPRGNCPPGNMRAIFCKNCGHVVGHPDERWGSRLDWEGAPE